MYAAVLGPVCRTILKDLEDDMCRAQCRMCVLKLAFDTVLMQNCLERIVSRTILKDLEDDMCRARSRMRVLKLVFGTVLMQNCL